MMDVAEKFTGRRGHTLAPIACLLLLAVLSGCVATKGDVRVLRSDIAVLRAHQDSLYQQSLRQMGTQADSVRMLTDLLRTTRGQLANQIRQLQEMLVTLQELSGQSAQSVRQLREQMQQQAQQPPPAAPQGAADADELYRAANEKLQEKSAAAARVAFQQFLSLFPQDARAADAQYGLAETYVLDDALADAVSAFARVAEAYPASTRAPEALFRAGDISEQRKRSADARRYYNLIVQRYGGSPSAELARKRLAKLNP